MKISIVIPVYNEEAGFQQFFDGVFLPELHKLKLKNYEIILVDDGSRDNTLKILQKIADKTKKLKTKRIKVLALSRNFGKEMALTAGIRTATGDAVITLDADGQQPPEKIGDFIKAWRDGALIVTGVRNKFKKHALIPKLGSKLFYIMMKAFAGSRTVPGETDFRLLDRSIVEEFNHLTEHERITRGLIDWMGFEQTYIYYDYGNRLAGKPSYNFVKLTKLAINSFVSLSITPLIIFGYLGVFITIASFLIGSFVIVEQWILNDPLGLNWTGPTQLAIFISFLVGIVLISQALTALYISHIHAETKNRPLYIIDKQKSRNL